MEKKQLFITFSDIGEICRRSKRTILLSTSVCAGLALLYTLMQPVEYLGEATFREKAKSAEASNSSSLAMIIGLPELNENAAISLMKSRKLIERTIARRDLQAKIVPTGLPLERFYNIPKNLVAEYAHFIDAERPLLKDPLVDIQARHVVFEGESPVTLKLRFVDEENYVVAGYGNGTLGKAFTSPSFSFTLVRLDSIPNLSYKITLKPMAMVAEELAKKIQIEPDYTDKGLLNLSFSHKNRHEVPRFLNTLMAIYQEFLKEEHQRIIGEQVAYLNRRQDEATEKLKEMMHKHAHALSENMASIEFLFHNQQSFSQKLFLIEFELNRLENALKEGVANYDKLGIETGDPSTINQILSEIRKNRQNIDSIDMAFRNGEHKKSNLGPQIKELEILRRHAKEAKVLLGAVEEGKPIPKTLSLFKIPKYMLQEWCDKQATCQKTFQAYLKNLIRFISLEEKLLQERLSSNQSPQSEFQGINLSTASQIYANYSKKINDMEADMLHYQFIIDRLKDPAFDPSSLSTVLEDPVSREMIQKASTISLSLKDEENHSPRELERLKLDLAQQKEFLSLHAQQTKQLLSLRHKLYQEKLLALQGMTRELLQQENALLEKSLSDYIENRINTLKQEQDAISKQQLILKETMKKMPDKWAAEKLVDQYLETNRKLMEEVAKMVESKNIALNLDLSQSAPVDLALSPLNPKSRKSVLFLILGALFGGFASISFLLARSVSNGLPATEENLTLLGKHVSGHLSPDSLRRALTHLPGPSLLLLTGKGPDYSLQLAELLSKSGKRTVILPLSFDKVASELPGLLQYLEGEADLPKIVNGVVVSGGISNFSSELLLSEKFRKLQKLLSQQYDYLIAVSRSPLTTADAEVTFSLFDQALITICDETLNELEPYLQAENKRVSFILKQNDF